jgi:hypothetical protein
MQQYIQDVIKPQRELEEGMMDVLRSVKAYAGDVVETFENLLISPDDLTRAVRLVKKWAVRHGVSEGVEDSLRWLMGAFKSVIRPQIDRVRGDVVAGASALRDIWQRGTLTDKSLFILGVAITVTLVPIIGANSLAFLITWITAHAGLWGHF